MDPTPVISGKRRFSLLSPRLLRLEFSPTGVFEDRRSLVAITRPAPLPFEAREEQDGRLTLRAGGLTVISEQNERDFFPANVRIDWKMGDCTQSWRFGDRDDRNLGGAVRSLDYYGRDGLLEGVHPAGAGSPDELLHTDAELFEINQAYMQDGHFDWQLEIMRRGLHGSLRSAPELVYNRYRNLADDLTRFQPGLLSRSGYFLLDDSRGAVLDGDNFPVERNTPGSRDLYFFAYGRDYPAALQDYRLLAGPIPLPAKNIFGLLFSRWPAFSDAEARQLVERFAREGLPLSGLALDLEWHVPDFSHWDWNPETYPDPEGFLQWAHAQGLLVMVNVHPQTILSTDSHFEPFLKASRKEHKVQAVWENPIVALTVKSGADRMVQLDLADPAEASALQELCCAPLLRQGVDFWWLDGACARLNGADGQLLSSKVFYETSERDGRRGLQQARYGGLGSHRYGVLFTGDAQSEWEVLQGECEFNIRAGQVGMAYVSHDTGGFSHAEAPLIDPDLYVRWLQFGVFNPVLRFHSAPGSGSRQPWDYGEKNLEIAKRWLKLRYSLLPHIYAAARRAYETGLPLVRGLYLEHPEDDACYRFDEYFFGDGLLVAPILTPSNHRSVYLPAGEWYDFETGKRLPGSREISAFAALEQVPVYLRAGTILVRQAEQDPPDQVFVADLLLDVYPGADARAELYEDDSRTQAYRADGFARTEFTWQEAALTLAGEPTRGQAFGAERHLQVRIALPSSPAKVSFQGADLPAEAGRYDTASQHLQLDLGVVPAGQGWELVITK
jgi:hypothetical protein